MRIKSQKDFFSGLMFTTVGAAFAVGATTYTVGNGARMGPGYFPLLLGIILAILGAVVMFKALVVETESGDKIGAWAWRPLFFIIVGNLLFGVLLGGLPSVGLPAMGLVLAIFALVAVASMAQASNIASDVWLGSVIGLALGGIVVGVLGQYVPILLEPGPYLAVRLGLQGEGLLKGWLWFAHAGGRILSFAAVSYVFYRYVPLKSDVKDYALLTLTLIALSVWSFVSLLGLQFQVWPTFISG